MSVLINSLLLLVTSLGLGFLILTPRLKRAEHSIAHLISVSLLTGMPAMSLSLILLGLARMPVAWWMLTPAVLFGLWQGWKSVQGKPWIAQEDRVWLVAWIIALGMFILMLHGSMQYPWLEDGDPWEHALTAEYVHDTLSILKPHGMYIAHYLPPYPPGMAVLEGAFWLGGSIIIWLKVFISLIIALMYPAFALLLKRLKLPDEVVIPSVIIAAMLPGVTHFIYAQQVALLFTLIALAWLPAAVRKGFWLPFAISAAAVLVTQQITSIFLITSSIVLYGFLVWEGAWKKGLKTRRGNEKKGEGKGKEEDGKEDKEKRKREREERDFKEGKDDEEKKEDEVSEEKDGKEEKENRRENYRTKGEIEEGEGRSEREGKESEKREEKEEERREEEKEHGKKRGERGNASKKNVYARGEARMRIKKQEEKTRTVAPSTAFARLARVTLAFTLSIIILAGSFYAVMFHTYGKQGVFGTYGISEKDSDSVWWHYIHPPEKRCAARLIGVNPTCKYPYYTLKDFWRTSSANSIDAGKGLGQAVVLYTLLGILVSLGLARRKQWKHPVIFLLAWLLLTLLGVYGDALPVAFLPHRWWAFLTWPVAGIAGIGIAWLSTSLSTLLPQPRKTAWIILLILLLPAWTTSMQPKIGLNTAVWPPHGYPTAFEYASWVQQHKPVGYLALTLTAPEQVKRMRLADMCSNTHSLLAGSGMRVPTTAPPVPAYTNTPRQDYYMWDIKKPDGKAWQLNTSNLSEKLKAYATAYGVEGFIISTSCVRQAERMNLSFENYTNTLISQLINRGGKVIWKDPSIILIHPPLS